MTNPAAAIAITYRGTDVQENPFGIFLELVGGINEVPSVRGDDDTVPARAGRTVLGRVRDALPIELRGWVAGQGGSATAELADFAALRQQVRALFDPTVSGALVATLEDGSTATIAARTMGGGLLWGQIVPTLASLSITMESVDPDWVIEAPAS